MSLATLERNITNDAGTDLATLVLAYHRRAHADVHPSKCAESMCGVAFDVAVLEASLLYHSDDN